MLIPFTSGDLGRAFDARALTRGRTLALLGEVTVEADGASLQVAVAHLSHRHTGRITPEIVDGAVQIATACTCRAPFCVHMAAGALVALERIAALRPTFPAAAPVEPAPEPAPAMRQRRAGRAGARTLPSLLGAPVPAMQPVLRLLRVEAPDALGRLQRVDALALAFDYNGVIVEGDEAPRGLTRDNAAEEAARTELRSDGFSQMRVAGGGKGRVVHVYAAADSAERWLGFIARRLPALLEKGWRSDVDPEFGPRAVAAIGAYDMRISDSGTDSFALDLGIEIEGERLPLLPILVRLLERGGIDGADIIDGLLVTSLEDGRILHLPVDRIRRLLSVIEDLIGAAGRSSNTTLVLPAAEAPGVLELEEVLTARWQNAAAIEAYTRRYREGAEIATVTMPSRFRGTLRPYQLEGVSWLQHLRGQGLGGFLADDMGLGKTAQTIAHITIEHAEGRLTEPALIVVPTSLVANWTAELAAFAPHLRVTVLHGLERHARRATIDNTHVAITTYTVLTRDIAEMRDIEWHMVVLDEAQVIKSPDAKATRAVRQLHARHRVCLSGTPIENNLRELWSEFAFLMPGLLGDLKGFTKRFRTPIEKAGDELRRAQLARRIRPFLLRRTKAEVAPELPPRHTILRRITLAPEQRELYDSLRASLHSDVRARMAALSPGQGRIVVLDALLKLRQACCDPRLVKLESARQVRTSSKLDDLMEVIGEMVPEGRRILLFSQFTSMLDLIKPRLQRAGIGFVELRGDTRDRETPIRNFQEGGVPLFLISLKAGGRGLNLTAADVVIHYDPWWNPAVEEQASDRAHRIGQTRPVFVYKMIAADTVEERILQLQARKAALAGLALTDEGEPAGLEADDIDFLFGAGPERMAA